MVTCCEAYHSSTPIARASGLVHPLWYVIVFQITLRNSLNFIGFFSGISCTFFSLILFSSLIAINIFLFRILMIGNIRISHSLYVCPGCRCLRTQISSTPCNIRLYPQCPACKTLGKTLSLQLVLLQRNRRRRLPTACSWLQRQNAFEPCTQSFHMLSL